jgi:hypothetical protein
VTPHRRSRYPWLGDWCCHGWDAPDCRNHVGQFLAPRL